MAVCLKHVFNVFMCIVNKACLLIDPNVSAVYTQPYAQYGLDSDSVEQVLTSLV